MENQEQTVTITFTRDEYRNLALFMKSLNMTRLSQNFDTDMLSMAIAQTVQTVASSGGEEDKETYEVELTEEMRRNLDIFLQNLNLQRLSQNTDTVTLSLAIVQVAQAIARAGQPAQQQEQVVKSERPARTNKPTKNSPSNVTPLRGEVVMDNE